MPESPSSSNTIVKLSKQFMTTIQTLTSYGDNVFTAMLSGGHTVLKNGDYYFIDRNPELFEVVLDYLRTGKLHIPPHLDKTRVLEEFKFYYIGTETLVVNDLTLGDLIYDTHKNALETLATIIQKEFKAKALRKRAVTTNVLMLSFTKYVDERSVEPWVPLDVVPPCLEGNLTLLDKDVYDTLAKPGGRLSCKDPSADCTTTQGMEWMDKRTRKPTTETTRPQRETEATGTSGRGVPS